jgi:hypothetical protein
MSRQIAPRQNAAMNLRMQRLTRPSSISGTPV